MNNFLYWFWRILFDPPCGNGTAMVMSPPPDAMHWLRMYPEPLKVVRREYIPTGLYIPAGYLYVLEHGGGGVCAFHEKWLQPTDDTVVIF